MYIFKNAIVSIARNKGRNLLIGIIILVISCATAVTLAINNSSSSLIESYKSKYEVEATLGVNRDNMMKDFNPEDRENSRENMQSMFNDINAISEEDISNYADSDYVKSYYYIVSIGVNADNLDKAEITSTNNNSGMEKDFGGKEPFTNRTSGDFTLKGYSSIESMTEFINGNYKIIDGEVSDDLESNYCLINSELATLNDISVGDTIKLIDVYDTSKTYELIVSGIYEEQNEEDNNMSMFASSVNTIITNANMVNAIVNNNDELTATTTPTFILNDSKSIDKFTEELTSKGLNENLTVQTNIDQVESATSTISNVKTFSTTFLIITLIIGTIVLLILNMINIRERKYEIGVLRTIGMKKSKVCLQFISELFVVSFVAILLGAGIGAAMSVPVSNSLLKSEISSSQNETADIMENFGKGGTPRNNNDFNKRFNGVATVQAFDSIDAVVDFKVLSELILIGLCITLISSLSAVTSIQKFSPLTILKERS